TYLERQDGKPFPLGQLGTLGNATTVKNQPIWQRFAAPRLPLRWMQNWHYPEYWSGFRSPEN
ncbi:MAG TPA: hypothetical protein VK494_01765, partial [Gemmatimonadaceae bacterium]|nr:hypothetical protein [Gemmatimonadaceae bacterium]